MISQIRYLDSWLIPTVSGTALTRQLVEANRTFAVVLPTLPVSHAGEWVGAPPQILHPIRHPVLAPALRSWGEGRGGRDQGCGKSRDRRTPLAVPPFPIVPVLAKLVESLASRSATAPGALSFSEYPHAHCRNLRLPTLRQWVIAAAAAGGLRFELPTAHAVLP